MCGFVALSVDLGLIATAKNQCQNAADVAAVAAARTLNGAAGSNLTQATNAAVAAAGANQILGQNVPPGDVSVRHGAYHYDQGSQTFYPQFPPVAPDNYNLSEVTITHTVPTSFASVLGITSTTVTAMSTAAHRPRDVAIVIDFSGSMNNESDVWNCESYLGSLINTPNNTDPVFPAFGPYDPAFSASATLQCTSSNPMVGLCNITHAVAGVPALVDWLFQNPRGSAAVGAFSPALASVTNTVVPGDQYLPVKNTSTPAVNWQQITGSSATKFTGYAPHQGGIFNGYTQGPGYWGKTFFLWPPDPNATAGVPNDWRKKFFKLTSGAPCNNNTKLWNGSGAWNDPSGNYIINYAAILDWIKNSGANPFPPELRAGYILYYDQIPADVPGSAYDHTQPNSNIADPNQRFWKEYIDFTLGVWRDPFGNIQRPGNPSCSYGPDFTCGGQAIKITGPDAAGPGGLVFIGAQDNPQRPRHRFWFGPITMVQYLLDTGLLPGTANDISMIAAKLGIDAALQDIQNNHPNDQVAMLFYSRPAFSGENSDVGQFTKPQVVIGRDYAGMINALWFPPNSGSADVRPWDANGLQAPRAHGDYCSNTATSYGLMMAYNQFTGSSVVQGAGVGGFGRKGAQKLVILETDGMANVATNAGTTNGGAYQSYYNLPPLGSVSSSGAAPDTDAVNVATQICALDTAASPLPGFSTTRNPCLIHCVVFGAIFEPTAAGATQSQAVALMQNISSVGHTNFPSSPSGPDGYKWCIGTLSQRQDKLRQAFTNILDQEVGIILVK
jgi:Flp pilus assembly protein TadG